MAGRIKLSKEDIERDYVNGGMTLAEVAIKHQVTTQCVSRALMRHGYKARKRTVGKKCLDASRAAKFKGAGEVSSTYLCSVRRNARVRRLEVEVTADYLWALFLEQGRRCAISGVPIKFSAIYNTKHLKEQTASLDRIDSSKGYLPGNVQWIHKTIQQMKWTMSDADFVYWCTVIADHNRRQIPDLDFSD